MIELYDILSAPGASLAGAAALGALGGYAFHRLWRRLMPREFSRRVLGRLPSDARAMLAAEDPAEMLACYRRVLLGIAVFGGRNAFALGIGLLPVAACFLLLRAADPSSRLALAVEAHPAGEVAEGAGPRSPWRLKEGRLLADKAAIGAGGLPVAAGEVLDRAGLAAKHAFCASLPSCLVFEMMLFETRRASGIDRSIVVRPAFLDGNPFWPYLNDLELAFFVAVMGGSLVAAIAGRERHAAA